MVIVPSRTNWMAVGASGVEFDRRRGQVKTTWPVPGSNTVTDPVAVAGRVWPMSRLTMRVPSGYTTFETNGPSMVGCDRSTAQAGDGGPDIERESGRVEQDVGAVVAEHTQAGERRSAALGAHDRRIGDHLYG